VAEAALDVTIHERLAERSDVLGRYLLEHLRLIQSSFIREVRGRGLFIGIELTEPARPYCEALMKEGLLCKETHENTIRLAPPLTIKKEELDWAIPRVASILRRPQRGSGGRPQTRS
jgi:ornithine--oxo-acid transaminase